MKQPTAGADERRRIAAEHRRQRISKIVACRSRTLDEADELVVDAAAIHQRTPRLKTVARA